jgi:glycosyltransferase involved in cell wall biosynthesis
MKLSIEKRYVGFHTAFDPLLRLLIPLLEKRTDINHVYGEISPWLYHKTLHKKPLILTIASEKGIPIPDFLNRCSAIVVQTKNMFDTLVNMSIEKEKIHLLYSGVDLKQFKPTSTPLPTKPLKILFATAPRSKDELKARGINLLIDTAKLLPETSFHLIFRKWATNYTSLNATRSLLHKKKLKNVQLLDVVINDMSKIYIEHHFTIIPYTTREGGKECPNSLVESLACGIPVLISDVSPFAYFIRENHCGIVFSAEPHALVKAINDGWKIYNELKKKARSVAKEYFSQKRIVNFYNSIYRKLISGNFIEFNHE